MDSYRIGSLLHPKIAKFYKIRKQNNDNENNCRYICENYTYNWNNLEELLLAKREWQREDFVYPKTFDEYFPYFQRLQIVFEQSKYAISQTTADYAILLSQLKWLGHETQMRVILQEYFHPSSPTSTVENLLFLTSILENGLANVYYTMTKKTPPHLLRDLFDTTELRHLLGICPILFLKIIMGSPDSVNLRNIIWHGFPLPSETPPCYVAVLLIAGASLSTIIKEKQITLTPRSQVTDFSRFVFKIKTSLDLSVLDVSTQIEKVIATSKWTDQSEHKAFWYQVLQHYQSERYWQFAILILPQIELVLRRLYGEANEFDITAKLGEYYITMDTIFESNDNRLLSDYLCRGTQHLLYDVFISPFGMRIRDKISHGEVDLSCITKDLCSILFYAGLNLVTSNRSYPLDEYESKFHLNHFCYESFKTSKRCVLEMMKLKSPSDCKMQFNWNKESITALEELEIVKPVQIFGRHKKEPEIVAILMKIAQLVAKVCENYQCSFKERFRMLLSHELRSRGRRTLGNMVTTIPVVGVTLKNIVQYLVGLSNLIQSEDQTWFEEAFSIIQRFCKKTLKILENFGKYSDKESNEWLNALECCTRFKEISNQFVVVRI